MTNELFFPWSWRFCMNDYLLYFEYQSEMMMSITHLENESPISFSYHTSKLISFLIEISITIVHDFSIIDIYLNYHRFDHILLKSDHILTYNWNLRSIKKIVDQDFFIYPDFLKLFFNNQMNRSSFQFLNRINRILKSSLFVRSWKIVMIISIMRFYRRRLS